jgi:RNA polymerase sigma-70 factor (ECF subfamily)
MPETSVSLLERLRVEPDPPSWQRLVDLYTPLIQGWLRRFGLQPQDADDLVQEVLAVVVRELPQFHYDPARGSFRAWLRAVTSNRLRAFWRARQARPPVAGGDDPARGLDQLEDPQSDLTRLWDQEHDIHIVRRLLAQIRPDFEPATWRAFERVVLDGVKPAVVAAELGMTVNAVFISKHRVLRGLRQAGRGLLE